VVQQRGILVVTIEQE